MRRQLQAALAVGGLLLLVASPGMARQDFAHYEIILKRKPFGEPAAAPVPVPVAAQVAPSDSFIKNLRLCAITENPAGIRVGLIDLGSKPPRSYFLYVGDNEDGVELVQADYGTERALLRKGSEEYWISMDAVGGGAATASASSVTTVASAGSPASRRTSYADRLRKRREAEEARMRELAAQPKVSPEELERSLQEFQMDVIRRGEPPLPIPLTPEMDDQLVSEGVLPPLE